MNWPKIEIWRMSASRPWQLSGTHPSLLEHLKYSGELEFHLIESVLVEDLSGKCIDWAKDNNYCIHIINPAQGQGYAMHHYLNAVAKSRYSLKWEDDFQAEKDIPLDDCIMLMEEYKHINQICFNKRETMSAKWVQTDHQKWEWPKEQRYFQLSDGRDIPLVVKDKWWFGSALWRNDFIKPIFKYWEDNTHNYVNDQVIMPLAGYVHGKDNSEGRIIPDAATVEKFVGCYIWGKHGDPRMVFHAGLGDSIWNGEMQAKWREQGKMIVGR